MKALLLALLLIPSAARAADPVEERVETLLAGMSLDEKASVLGFKGVARLNIPAVRVGAGPAGARGEGATVFPAGIMLAATFDAELVGRVAAAVAEEALAGGGDIILGPTLDLARVPHAGRTFEGFGEDPQLASILGAAYVAAAQGRKAVAVPRHLGLANQELSGAAVDARAGQRPLYELYYAPFQAAARAGALGMTAAVNKIDGRPAYHAAGALKKAWAFPGFLAVEGKASEDAVGPGNAGIDAELGPTSAYGGGRLQAALRRNLLTRPLIDDKVRRVLRALILSGAVDRAQSGRPPRSAVNSPAHQETALRAAQEGVVLLKNSGVLPLETSPVKTIAVLGPSALELRAGGGSMQLSLPKNAPGPLDALRERAGARFEFKFARGVKMPGDLLAIDASLVTSPQGGRGFLGEYFANPTLQGAPAFTRADPAVDFDWGDGSPDPRLPADGFSARWTGKLTLPRAGTYELGLRGDDAARLYIDGQLAVDGWAEGPSLTRSKRHVFEAGRAYELKVEYRDLGGRAAAKLGWLEPVAGRMQEAVAAAAAADAAVIFAGLSDQQEGEGLDRATLELPEGQAELIDAVSKVNKNVIVVLQGGGPILLSRWIDRVQAVLFAWYPGQEGGRAIADVLLGRVNPSGRLPISLPRRWEESPVFGRYPGRDGVVDYSEGLLLGYRHFDKRNVVPLFPFGHGLSYTTFAYLRARVTAKDDSVKSPDIEVAVDVKNTGTRAGTEVVQLYVRDEAPKTPRPLQELEAFQRVELQPGETKRVTFRLTRENFAWYDESSRRWELPPGPFQARFGASSRDIRASQTFELK